MRCLASLILLSPLCLVAGCDAPVGPQPKDAKLSEGKAIPPDNMPPSIEVNRLSYDPITRTLMLYDIVADPATARKGRWEIWLDQRVVIPERLTISIPADVDEAKVSITAKDPPGPPSKRVKLADVPRKP